LNEKTIGEGKSWMGVELRERKWYGVLGIEKVGVECCWMVLTIVNGLMNMKDSTSFFSILSMDVVLFNIKYITTIVYVVYQIYNYLKLSI